jgi:hypothetical protein
VLKRRNEGIGHKNIYKRNAKGGRFFTMTDFFFSLTILGHPIFKKSPHLSLSMTKARPDSTSNPFL